MAGKSTMRFSASKNRLRRRAGTFWNAGLDFADLPAVACIKNLSPLTSREVLEDRSLHDAEKIFLDFADLPAVASKT